MTRSHMVVFSLMMFKYYQIAVKMSIGENYNRNNGRVMQTVNK